MPAFLEMGAPSLMLKEGLPLKKQHTTHRERPDPFSLSLSHTHIETQTPLLLSTPSFVFPFR